VRAIARVPTDIYEHPRIPVTIFDCGQIDDAGHTFKKVEDFNSFNLALGSEAVQHFEKLHPTKKQNNQEELKSDSENDD